MCSESGPDPQAFRRNLAVPMPLHRKLGLIVRNTVRKFVRLSDCCGHPGEPGC
jgi:hypothetical protein